MLPGAFHALLEDVAVSAFDNATAHGQACLTECGILHSLLIVGAVALERVFGTSSGQDCGPEAVCMGRT